MENIRINIIGMHCASCVAAIENALKKGPGVVSAKVNLATEQAFVQYDPGLTGPQQLHAVIRNAGYRTVQGVLESDIGAQRLARESRIRLLKTRFLVSLALSAPLMYLSFAEMFGLRIAPFFIEHSALIQFLLATPVLLCGADFFEQGILGLLRTGRANMNTLVALGVGSAYLYSLFISLAVWFGGSGIGSHGYYYETAAFLITFILLGRYLEATAKTRTSEAIYKLLRLAPETALVLRDGSERQIPASEIVIGDIVIVKPGSRVAADGIVVDGFSSVDESMVTGESMPVDKSPGKEVIAGTINKTGSFKFEAIKVGQDTMLSQIARMVQQAQGAKAPIQQFADVLAAYFVPAVFLTALIVFVHWTLMGKDFVFALSAFISVLIIACPCALGLATPTAVIMGTGLAAGHGILIKNASSLELAYQVSCVVLDKTGTLTRGQPRLTDVIAYHGRSKNDILLLAASMERYSTHPLAEAVVQGAQDNGLTVKIAGDFFELPGKGVMATVDGEHVFLGNRKLLEKKNVLIAEQERLDAERLENDGKTVMFLVKNAKVEGMIAVGDTLKDYSLEAIKALKRLGKQVVMITGDNKRTADALARLLAVDRTLAEVLPQDKAAQIKELQRQGMKVAMVGDGINDAPALAQADIGIAIGSGSDIAIESADIVLIKDDLRDVVTAMDVSRYTIKKIRQNLFWAFFYNLIGIPIAAGVLYPLNGFLLNPMIASIAMAASSVSVVSNSVAMRRYRRSL